MDPGQVDLRSQVYSGYHGIKKEWKMEAKIKGKTKMVVEYVIRDKDRNIKEQGVEDLNEGGEKE